MSDLDPLDPELAALLGAERSRPPLDVGAQARLHLRVDGVAGIHQITVP